MNKDLLISFINSLFDGKETVKELTYLTTEQLGTTETDRRAVFDVYCTNEKGEKILVEMQKGEQEFFKDRSVYYATFPIREQARKGNWNYELKAVYIIGILDFTFGHKDKGEYRHDVQLIDKQAGEVFFDKLTFVYLEMPKFNKAEDRLESMFEKWLFVLKNLSRLLERPKALQERIFTKLFETAEIARFSPEEYYAYEESLKVYRDWQNTVAAAESKGRKEERVKNARGMKAEGIPIEIVMKITGLSAEEINAL